MQPKPTSYINCYTLAEFVEQIQKNILEGKRIALDSNEGYPQGFMGHYSCGFYDKAIEKYSLVGTEETLGFPSDPEAVQEFSSKQGAIDARNQEVLAEDALQELQEIDQALGLYDETPEETPIIKKPLGRPKVKKALDSGKGVESSVSLYKALKDQG